MTEKEKREDKIKCRKYTISVAFGKAFEQEMKTQISKLAITNSNGESSVDKEQAFQKTISGLVQADLKWMFNIFYDEISDQVEYEKRLEWQQGRYKEIA